MHSAKDAEAPGVIYQENCMCCCFLNTISAMSNVFGFLDTTACPATDARQPSVVAPGLLS